MLNDTWLAQSNKWLIVVALATDHFILIAGDFNGADLTPLFSSLRVYKANREPFHTNLLDFVLTKEPKVIKGLLDRICKLESSFTLLQTQNAAQKEELLKLNNNNVSNEWKILWLEKRKWFQRFK